MPGAGATGITSRRKPPGGAAMASYRPASGAHDGGPLGSIAMEGDRVLQGGFRAEPGKPRGNLSG